MNHTEAPKKTKATPLSALPLAVAITGYLLAHKLIKNLKFWIRGSQSSPWGGCPIIMKIHKGAKKIWIYMKIHIVIIDRFIIIE